MVNIQSVSSLVQSVKSDEKSPLGDSSIVKKLKPSLVQSVTSVVKSDEKSLLGDTSINKKLKRISYATDITDVNLLKGILKNNEDSLNKNNTLQADSKAASIKVDIPIDNEDDKEYTNDELKEKKIARRLSIDLETLNSVNSIADVEHSQDSLQKSP